ncbi:hypothetical protein DZC76_21065 [Pseudomonas sp. phDV1]|nr:hypothetical protein DZC76_21065 [Pseudomonas sp. phDV1]
MHGSSSQDRAQVLYQSPPFQAAELLQTLDVGSPSSSRAVSDALSPFPLFSPPLLVVRHSRAGRDHGRKNPAFG